MLWSTVRTVWVRMATSLAEFPRTADSGGVVLHLDGVEDVVDDHVAEHPEAVLLLHAINACHHMRSETNLDSLHKHGTWVATAAVEARHKEAVCCHATVLGSTCLGQGPLPSRLQSRLRAAQPQ